MTTKSISAASRMAVLAAAVTSATLLGACAPLLIGGAMVGTALSVSDRRTGGAQFEDQAIELKAISRVREAAGSAKSRHASRIKTTAPWAAGRSAADTRESASASDSRSTSVARSAPSGMR